MVSRLLFVVSVRGAEREGEREEGLHRTSIGDLYVHSNRGTKSHLETSEAENVTPSLTICCFGSFEDAHNNNSSNNNNRSSSSSSSNNNNKHGSTVAAIMTMASPSIPVAKATVAAEPPAQCGVDGRYGIERNPDSSQRRVERTFRRTVVERGFKHGMIKFLIGLLFWFVCDRMAEVSIGSVIEARMYVAVEHSIGIEKNMTCRSNRTEIDEEYPGLYSFHTGHSADVFGGPEEKQVDFELYDGLIDLVEADMDVEIGEKVYDPMTGVDDGANSTGLFGFPMVVIIEPWLKVEMWNSVTLVPSPKDTDDRNGHDGERDGWIDGRVDGTIEKCRTTIHREGPNNSIIDNDDNDNDDDDDVYECVGVGVLERENRTSRLTGTSPLPRRRQHRCLAQPRGINRLSLSLRFSHARVDYILINYIDHDEASDGRVDGLIYERIDGSVDGFFDERIEVSVDVSVKGRVDGRVDGRVESVMQPFILHIQAASSLTTTTKTTAATK